MSFHLKPLLFFFVVMTVVPCVKKVASERLAAAMCTTWRPGVSVGRRKFSPNTIRLTFVIRCWVMVV